MMYSANTRLIALLGDPVAHSVSPLIHNLGFDQLGLDLAYLAFNVRAPGLGDAIRALRSLGFAGANVTIPHKQEVIFFLDDLTPRAESVGAVNTIICRKSPDGESPLLIGDNTDVLGFMHALKSHAKRLEAKEALVWGAGGVARATAYTLINEMKLSRVHIVSRSVQKGEDISRTLDGSDDQINVVNWDYSTLAMQQSTLLVNATPLGMTPNTNDSPCLHPELLRSDQIVFDLVYNPRQTTLLKQATERGAQTVEGLDMLIGQAAASFHAWTGEELPLESIQDSVRSALRV